MLCFSKSFFFSASFGSINKLHVHRIRRILRRTAADDKRLRTAVQRHHTKVVAEQALVLRGSDQSRSRRYRRQVRHRAFRGSFAEQGNVFRRQVQVEIKYFETSKHKISVSYK